jgi:hypothetical protein
MRARRDWLQIGGNALLIAALSWFIWLEWNRGLQPGEVTMSPAPGKEERPLFPSLRSPLSNLSAYAEIVRRPLFSRDRRPPSVAAPSIVARPPAAIRELRLTGIVIGPDTRTAILSDGKRKKEVRLSKGEAYKGWTLQELADDGVVFTHGERTVELPLVTPRAVQGKAGAAAGGAGVPRNPYLSRRQRMREL